MPISEIKGALKGGPTVIEFLKIFSERWQVYDLTIRPFYKDNYNYMVTEFVWSDNGAYSRRRLYIYTNIDHLIVSGTRILEPFTLVVMSSDDRSFDVIEHLTVHFGGYMMDDRIDTPLGKSSLWVKVTKEDAKIP